MKQVKWGILGCGWIANKFAEALQGTEQAVLYAAASREKSKAESFAGKYGIEVAYGSYREMVADPEVDIVYVATPHSYHFAHTKLCLEAGKHVLCEKPFTINAEQLKILIRLAGEKKRFVMEAIWTRFLPGICKVKALIEEGAIGEVVTMEADFGMNFPYDPNHRIFNPILAGGALLDIGIYPLFLSMYLFGTPDMLQAYAVLDENQVDLTTSMITRNGNGPVCHLYSTSRTNTPVVAAIYGSKGHLSLANWWFTPVDITLYREGKEPEVMKFPPVVNGYEYEAMESVSCLIKGETESKVMPHRFSLDLMETLDRIRKMTGITYPREIESVDAPFGWNEL